MCFRYFLSLAIFLVGQSLFAQNGEKARLAINSNLGYQSELNELAINIGMEIPIYKRFDLSPSYSKVINRKESEINIDLRAYLRINNLSWYLLGGFGQSKALFCPNLDCEYKRVKGVNLGAGLTYNIAKGIRINSQAKFHYALLDPYFFFQSGLSFELIKKQ